MRALLTCAIIFTAFIGRAQHISGLYSGTLYNDTTKMLQYYQLALSEYRGKITGYSYTTFVRNDSSFYGIRTVKGVIRDHKLFVEDDKLLFHNFPEAPAKGVRRLSVLSLPAGEDTLATANGSWATNRTKQYLPVTGSVELKRDNDSTHSALIGHLKELEVIGRSSASPAGAIAPTSSPALPVPAPIVGAPPVLSFRERANRTIEHLSTASDSVVLSFYDNGVVDGDIISVYVNGQPLVTNAKLTEAALKKTVQFANAADLEILLVAENLGTLPPNTGLLVVNDGTVRHNVAFSADLKTNARIIPKRKK